MNYWSLTGGLVRDPETRQAGEGTITKGTVGCTERYKGKDGWTERSSFFDFQIWGKRGEAFAQHNKKGAQVLLEGQAKQDSWDDKKTGQKRTKITMNVTNWEFHGGGKGGGSSRPERQEQRDLIDETPF